MTIISTTPDTAQKHYLRLLKISPFQQRSGGWRFGARRMSDSVIARLIASGRARIEGEQLKLSGATDGAPCAALSKAEGAQICAGCNP